MAVIMQPMRCSIFNFQFSIRSLLAATLLATAACHPAREQTAASPAEIPIGVYGALTGGEAAFGQATVPCCNAAPAEPNNAPAPPAPPHLRLTPTHDHR